MEDVAQELGNNRHRNNSSRVHTAEDHRYISTNKELNVRNRNTDVGNNLVEDRRKHFRCAVILLDVFCPRRK